jgi:hypothetical protein
MMRWICAAIMSVGLGACGDVAYQTGAGGDQFAKDRTACASDDETAYKTCMHSHGWTLVDIDSLKPKFSMGSSTQTPAASGTTSSTPAPATAGKPEKAVPVTPAAPVDPNTVITVNSWWKFGATNFKGDATACTDKLGATHRYNEADKTTTRAFAMCMREHGWYAY